MKRKPDWNDIPVSTKRKCRQQYQWVQCDYCAKWRRVPADKVFYGEWSCAMNTNKKENSCSKPQEIQISTGEYRFKHFEIVDVTVKKKRKHSKHKVKTPSKKSTKSKSDSEKKKSAKTEKKTEKKSGENSESKPKPRKSIGPKVDDTLNKLDGDDAKLNKQRRSFYQKIVKFNGKEPHPTILNGQIVDLYLLYKYVKERGGYDKVCEKKQWREVFRALPQGGSKSHTSASFTLKKVYTNHLKGYEDKQTEKKLAKKNKEAKKTESSKEAKKTESGKEPKKTESKAEEKVELEA